MSKSFALLLVLVFLTASCIIVAEPVLSSTDVVENSWVSKAPLPIFTRAIIGVNGKLYAFSGSGDFGNESYSGDAVLEYDPISDMWAARRPMPTLRYDFSVATFQNKIYLMGGRKVADSEVVGTNEIYDPVTDMWEAKAPMPTPRTQLEANVVNGKIYLIGGSSNVSEVYDPAADLWTTATPPPIPVTGYASAVVNGKIYVIGGSDESHNIRDLNQIYDPESDTWSFGAPLPNAVRQAAAGAKTEVMAPKRIYVIGGVLASVPEGTDINQRYTNVNQVYNPETDSWTLGAPMPTARFDLSVVVLNDSIYALGGWPFFNLGVVSLENEQYTPIGYGTVPPKVAVVSPENKTYNATSVDLVFSVNKPAVWMGYSLDGQENVTVTGNATLSGLSSGLHNITIYARDSFDNMGASESISFSVEVPFPTTLVATAIGASVAIIGIGLLVYFKKRKR